MRALSDRYVLCRQVTAVHKRVILICAAISHKDTVKVIKTAYSIAAECDQFALDVQVFCEFLILIPRCRIRCVAAYGHPFGDTVRQTEVHIAVSSDRPLYTVIKLTARDHIIDIPVVDAICVLLLDDIFDRRIFDNKQRDICVVWEAAYVVILHDRIRIGEAQCSDLWIENCESFRSYILKSRKI